MLNQYLDFEEPIVKLKVKIEELKNLSSKSKNLSVQKEIKTLTEKCEKLKQKIFRNLSVWQRVQLARHPSRPYTLDYIQHMTSDFIELHGDRSYKDDNAIIGGIGFMKNFTVMIIGHQKGRNTQENIKRNFAMPHPEGYRKALRLMKLAEKFSLPIVTLIDTPGAYPGIQAEERGQGEAIARNLKEMSNLKVPIVSIVIGEGGSGGALAIGVANRVLMLENSIYSVISPEGCASILWRNAKFAQKASEVLKLTANDLLSLKVIEEIIQEPLGGAHTDLQLCVKNVKRKIIKHLNELRKISNLALVDDRYKKFRKIGEFIK